MGYVYGKKGRINHRVTEGTERTTKTKGREAGFGSNTSDVVGGF